MCKLLIITGALHKGALQKALAATNKEFARTERNGFGFIATANGRYARGRYFEPDGFRGFGSGLPQFLTGEIAEENHLPKVSESVIIHGRTATSAKRLSNCHPFLHGNEALAHNGVVDWIGSEASEPPYECDSEQFFMWLKGQGHLWHESKHAFAGWGAMAHVEIASGVVTIARDGAQLSIAKREDNPGWVIATKAEHLVKVCKASGIRLKHSPLLLPNGKLLTISRRGAIVSAEEWSGFGTRQLTYLDEQSWGGITDGLRESIGKKGRRHRGGARWRQDHGSNPSLWRSIDPGGEDCGEE